VLRSTLGTMSQDLHATVDEQLRRSRQRYTSGRRQLVELLADTARPVTIPELRELGAHQSQSSLYRNLAVLEQAGAVHRMTSTDDVARYELTEELIEHHHHVVCSRCGHVEDVILPVEVERTLTVAAERAAAAHGYTIETHRFELVGRCRDCA
jgi:Fur family transcriptional regulator, ferric uptake regulator